KYLAAFRDVGDAEMRSHRSGDLEQIDTLEMDGAGARPHDTGNRLEQRRCAGAVRSDDCHELSGLNRQRNILQDGKDRIAGADTLKSEHTPSIFFRDRLR